MGREVVKLDVGCGGCGSRWPGFTGIDVHPTPPATRQPYTQLDFVHGQLQWEPGTVDEIIALHVIEHMPHADGRVLVQRAMGLLKIGGMLTVTTPDLRLLAAMYLGGVSGFWARRSSKHPERHTWPGPTLADRFNFATHCYGHEWIYDLESLSLVMQEAGCGNVTVLDGTDAYMVKDHEVGLRAIRTGHETPNVLQAGDAAELEERLARWAKQKKS